MSTANQKKTLRVLYFYLTIPLLLVALVVWLSFDGRKDSVSSDPTIKAITDPGMCIDKTDCYIGEVCVDSICRNPLIPNSVLSEPQLTEPPETMSDAGWIAIITALMGGLTGLLGAVTHTIIAFTQARDRKRS